MPLDYTVTRNVRTQAGAMLPSAMTTSTQSGDSNDERQLPLINSTTQVFTCNWVATGLKVFCLASTIAATVTIKDDEGDTVGTVTLVANKPYQWVTGDGTAPISGDALTFNVSTVATGTLYVFVLQNSGISGSAVLTGTFLTTPTESEVVTGGQTIILTLTNATWAAAGTAFNGVRQAIIDGITSAQAEAAGWNAQVKPTIALTDVARTSSTVVTVTLPATAGYSITTNETVTVTVPPAATSVTNPIIATPDITIVANS